MIQMSKQIHAGESDRRRQIKFRAPEQLIERFDEFVKHSEHSSRSDALREAMRASVTPADQRETPREPPVEQELREAYLTLCRLANYAGLVPHEVATNELATTLGKSKSLISRTVLKPLRRRGYLKHESNVYGDRAYRIRGWEE